MAYAACASALTRWAEMCGCRTTRRAEPRWWSAFRRHRRPPERRGVTLLVRGLLWFHGRRCAHATMTGMGVPVTRSVPVDNMDEGRHLMHGGSHDHFEPHFFSHPSRRDARAGHMRSDDRRDLGRPACCATAFPGATGVDQGARERGGRVVVLASRDRST